MTDDNDSDDSFMSYVKLLVELSDDDSDDTNVEEDYNLNFIVRSSAEDITEEAFENVKEKMDEDEEIPYENPRSVLVESERQFANMREALIEKIEVIKRKEEESVSGADIDSMLYIIEKNAGKTGKFTLLGGAESLIYNTANNFGWNKYERELVYEANRLAAEENNLHRHLLLDTVVVIPHKDVVN